MKNLDPVVPPANLAAEGSAESTPSGKADEKLFDPTVALYTETSDAGKKVWRAGRTGVVATFLTIAAAVAVAVLPKGNFSQVFVFMLAASWAIAAPMWFFYEYFFIYRVHGTLGSWDQFKHGQQVSAAVWAGLTASLTVFAASDYVKVKSDKYICELPAMPVAASQPSAAGTVFASCKKDG